MIRFPLFRLILLQIFVLLIVTQSYANVTGIVRGVQENPIAGALVIFTSEANPADTFSGYTNAGGRYDIAIAALGVGDVTPAPFALRQNHPNPFNPATTITFATTEAGPADLSVYNVIGQKVRTLVRGTIAAGEHAVVWDGRDDVGMSVGAGVYLYRLAAGGKAQTRKMLLLDGGATAGGSMSALIPAASKPSVSTWTVTITGDDIEYREMNGLEIADGGVYDFYVIFMGELMNFHLVEIPGGTFEMGKTWTSRMDSSFYGPPHMVILDGFEISAFEITNTQYAQYLNEALAAGEIEMVGPDPYGKGGEWDGKRYIDLDIDRSPNVIPTDRNCRLMFDNGSFKVEESISRNWPVVAVTWYGAKAFAQHYGLDLPTEAEWEYAAGGGTLEYDYATDDGTIGPAKANYGYLIGHPTEVGSYPSNPFGLYDMTGNVCEWCNDWYYRYPSLYDETNNFDDRDLPPSYPIVNPVGPETGISNNKIQRGGDYDTGTYVTTTYRNPMTPEGHGQNQEPVGNTFGFRVVQRSIN